MDYINWNKGISEYFFNPSKAEKRVYLFITDTDIVRIGRKLGLFGKDGEIFTDFINALKTGVYAYQTGVPASPIKEPIELFNKWKLAGDTDNGYPPYIAYLSLYILPLTQPGRPEYNYNNYYGRVNDYFSKYKILNEATEKQIGTLNFQQLDFLWRDLEDWSIMKMNTELGYFELHVFSNPRWIYVGKPLSQCLFPVYSLESLPQLFADEQLVPGDEISNDKFRTILIRSGRNKLNLPVSVINAIRDENNELGQSVISIVKKSYRQWKGATDYHDAESNVTKKGYTIAQLKLCLKFDRLNSELFPYYRLYSQLDYPEDLLFNETIICKQHFKGWSKPISLDFLPCHILEDRDNKWKAIFPEKDIRLFIEGKNYHLTDWVEVSNLIVTAETIIIVKSEWEESIENWCNELSCGSFKRLSVSGLPSHYLIYSIKNPSQSHPEIPQLQFSTDRKIEFINGIKVGIRKYLKDCIPEVEIENGHGDEMVFLVYENSLEKVPLEKKATDQPIWLLPANIRMDTYFSIGIEGVKVEGDKIRIIIVDYDPVVCCDDDALPKRDKYGQLIEVPITNNCLYAAGSRVYNIDYRRQQIYIHSFRPLTSDGEYAESDFFDKENENDLLLNYLTYMSASTAEEFYESFEVNFHNRFTESQAEKLNIELSKIKRWSLNLYDYMGFLDYEYSNRRIVVNQPQLVLIPTMQGRNAVLIGGRSPILLQKLWEATLDKNLQFSVEVQDESLSAFSLPNKISITGFDDENGYNIERKLNKIASECNVLFEIDKIPQFALSEFSGDIVDYEKNLKPNKFFNDYGWIIKKFDQDKIHFSSSASFSQDLSLVEYKLNEYTFLHILWMNGQSYNVNKNWGRYILLNKHGKQIIYNDRNKELIAIPAATPLPRLIAEAMTLFSGRAPSQRFLSIGEHKTWFNLYYNIPHVFAYNVFKKIGQTINEIEINLT